MTCTRESGTCEFCREGCTIKPGWFLPGEAEHAAGYLGLPLAEFFRKFLAVDWWEADHRIDRTTFVLSPAINGSVPGEEFPGDPRGTCVFYKGGRCGIHPFKPFECRERWCGERDPGTTHQDTAQAWAGHQDVISALLGREPLAETYDGGLFGLFGGW